MTRSFPEIEHYLSEYAGLNPAAIPGLVGRAVERRLAQKHLNDSSEYLQLMRSSQTEFDSLLEQVLVPETWFFRYPDAYQYMKRWAVNRLQEPDRTPLRKLKIFSVPCSTGEEPYSIAIALLDAGLRPEQFQIDAADISHTALKKARTGRYTPNSFRGTDLHYRDRYFIRQSEEYELKENVLSLVKFFLWNAQEPPPPQVKSSYDIIFCRNLLIYFHPTAQKKMIGTLTQLLDSRGLLFAGHAEAGPLLSPAFRALAPMKAFVHGKQQ
jgi:chemotaxis protein methyltransferase WspC